ncbi:hypothetical protein [Vibrio parahaemolyticus]|uniref:hypothetical protein n=1 Tax=Vibrio parahaemolyticus TaxID=670 RepID=UPI0011AE4F2D|nr:hypothetical protein [Vibrio parahaemolyticus]
MKKSLKYLFVSVFTPMLLLGCSTTNDEIEYVLPVSLTKALKENNTVTIYPSGSNLSVPKSGGCSLTSEVFTVCEPDDVVKGFFECKPEKIHYMVCK